MDCSGVELCRCAHSIWEGCLQSSKSTRPQGCGWRQTVMLSLRRKVAEKIRTHTENISIEPLSSCAGFVRMTQLSCEEKWWGKLNRPAQRLSSAVLFLPNWCGLAAPSVQPVCPTITDCCCSLRCRHRGELAHYTQVDKITREAERKWDTARMKGRDLLKSFFSLLSECIYWSLSREWFQFYPGHCSSA